jgi:hypothetical protein
MSSLTDQEPRANSEIPSTFPHLRLTNLNRLLLSSFGFWKNKCSVLRNSTELQEADEESVLNFQTSIQS